LDLKQKRILTSELSGGISSKEIKDLVFQLLQSEKATGKLLDFGAGKGEILTQLHTTGNFDLLAGIDLFKRPPGLSKEILWYEHDLNDPITLNDRYDVVVCSEVIEHLENPRQTFRLLKGLLKTGGLLILTMPNQESLRSYLALLYGGHFAQFLGSSYPAHITALLRLDLTRLCRESGFSTPKFYYTCSGGIPKLPKISWQSISFGLLKGRLFSDNIAMTTYTRSDSDNQDG